MGTRFGGINFCVTAHTHPRFHRVPVFLPPLRFDPGDETVRNDVIIVVLANESEIFVCG